MMAINIVFSQNTNLFSHNWKLEQIDTDNETFTPNYPQDQNGNDINVDFINFNNLNGFYEFSFGAFNSILAEDLTFSSTNTFTISFITLTFGNASDASLFMADNFLYNDQQNDVISNPFDYTFTTQNNTIYLDITNSEGSVATFYDNVLSQEEFLNQKLKAYPNPVVDNLFIESNNTLIQELHIYDLSGKIVLKQDSLENNQLDVSNLRQGIYIVKINTSDGSVNKKIIKQ